MSEKPPHTWVLLRGLTREAGHWGRFLHDFAKVQVDAKVITLDFHGNGVFHDRPSATDVSGIVQQCRDELARRGEQGPYRLLAMSLGAMVAVQWCHEAPDDISACVLINTSMRPFSKPWQRLRPGNYPTFMKLLMGHGEGEACEQRILDMTSNDPKAHQAALSYWVQIRQRRPVTAINALRQLWAAATYRAPALRPRCPVLILASADDQLVQHQCSLAIAEAWGCPIEVHRWAGHDLPLDDARWVITKVALWLMSQKA